MPGALVSKCARGEDESSVRALSPSPLTVERVTSVSGPRDGVNQFRVEARLAGGSEAQLRPGMEGVAKIAIDERKLAWIWSRGLLDRLRLFFWNWMP